MCYAHCRSDLTGCRGCSEAVSVLAPATRARAAPQARQSSQTHSRVKSRAIACVALQPWQAVTAVDIFVQSLTPGQAGGVRLAPASPHPLSGRAFASTGCRLHPSPLRHPPSPPAGPGRACAAAVPSRTSLAAQGSAHVPHRGTTNQSAHDGQSAHGTRGWPS